jgi:hypothetical protein
MADPRDPSRRHFLGKLGAMCAAGASARLLRAADPPGEPAFRFLVVNDLHHAAPECTPFFEAMIAQMKSHGPVAFCLAVGDIADTGLPDSLVAMRGLFATLGAPVYTVPGNHECDVAWNTAIYNEVFPDRLNYHFTHDSWQFIGFDSTEGNAWHDTTIGDEAIAFLDRTVPTLDPRAPAVVFTHFPLAAGIRLAPLNAAEVLARFDRLNLKAVFGGHFHARTERDHRSAVVLTNACCSRVSDNHDGSIREGYLLCSAFADGRLVREFIDFAPARKKIPL